MVKNILCTTSSFGSAQPDVLARLENKGFTPVLNPFKRKLTLTELEGLIAEHDPVGMLAGTEPIPESALTASGCLKVISRVGVGWDNVDKDAASQLGIKVYRTEGVLNDAVAELTLGLMLSVLRQIGLHDRLMRAGTWQKHTGSLLKGKTVGIIGFGSIGMQVGQLCRAFGAKIVFHDTITRDVDWALAVSKEDLVTSADIITIHADGDAALITRDDIVAAKDGVVLINSARGGMIEEAALHQGLVSGKVGGAGLDVYDQEPYSGELIGQDRVVLTPHIGSYAREARADMEKMAVNNLFAGFGIN